MGNSAFGNCERRYLYKWGGKDDKMDKASPKYLELVRWINTQIQEKKLTAGQKMYSENELKEMFGVSRQTVRHAISVLEGEGMIRRVRGSGTYINDNRFVNLSKRMRVAVVTTYVDGYIFPRTIQGIENVLLEEGYSVQIAFTNNQVGKEKTILEDILNRDEVAGIIVETTKSGIPNPNMKLYREILKRGIQVIFINSYYQGIDIPHVSINDKMAGYRMTKYLIDMGHTKIGGIFKLDDGQGQFRYAGYMEAMLEAGLEIDDTRILWIDTVDIRRMDRLTDRVMERYRDCTGLFCYNDEVAFGLLEVFKKAGISVPRDISITSVDDSELAVLGEVGITSAPHPMEKLGKKAAENLLQMIKAPFADANFEFDVDIVQRDSVRRLDTAT